VGEEVDGGLLVTKVVAAGVGRVGNGVDVPDGCGRPAIQWGNLSRCSFSQV
jgi:hypothetical protein